ncbi:LysE family translocator [Flavobacteriaceae bacterium S356]|uniref:LysE family translocator n=1 Tax=Asprobacillus argus TaxID=3076534 RepID=A0ABU3LEK5_9FLAO|nr:LysE family translocator [Flavobacteriaceae bacterium S356]
MDIEILLSFILATAVLACSPGPDNIFVLTQSIVNGKKHGFATVLGLMTGCIIHTTLVAFGVSAILKENENLFFVIKLFGASYLLYLAFQIFKSKAEIMISTTNVEKTTAFQLFKTGFWMNVLNPKVTIFFLAFFPRFLFSEEMSSVLQFYVLGGLFILTSFTIFSSIAFLGGTLSEYIKKHQNVGLYLKWIQIIVFVAIAVFILI